MEELLQQAREKGFLKPSRRFGSEAEMRAYFAAATLKDLTGDALGRLAKLNRLRVSGTKQQLIDRLSAAGVAIPQLDPPGAVQLINENVCRAWSAAERTTRALQYGISPYLNPDEICTRLESAQAESLIPVELKITIQQTGRLKSRTVSPPLRCDTFVKAELLAIVDDLGLYSRPAATNAELCTMLNRVLQGGGTIQLIIEGLPFARQRREPVLPYQPRSNVLLPRNNPLQGLPGCFNTDVKTVAAKYNERGHTYCFEEKDLDELRKTGINPYSGLPLALSFMRWLGVEKEAPSPEKDCTPCPDPNKPCINETPLSDEAFSWTYNWMGPGVFGMNKAVYRVPASVRLELAKYKRCESIKVWRGMNFTEEAYHRYFETNRRDRFSPLTLNSWTTDKAKAAGYATKSMYGIVFESILQPNDIFLDTNLLPSSYWAKNAVGRQNEVIALPGDYHVEIISDNYLDEQESVRKSSVSLPLPMALRTVSRLPERNIKTQVLQATDSRPRVPPRSPRALTTQPKEI